MSIDILKLKKKKQTENSSRHATLHFPQFILHAFVMVSKKTKEEMIIQQVVQEPSCLEKGTRAKNKQ